MAQQALRTLACLDPPATNMSSLTKSQLIFLVTLCVYATALAPVVGDDQRNFLVIALSMLTPPLIFISRLRVLRDVMWASTAILYSCGVSLLRGGTGNLTTVAYTTLFACSYLAVAGALRSGRISRELVLVTLRRLIYLYTAVALLQLFASLAGLPVPNEILSKGLWSYNSLAVEPSHAGRFLSITLLAYLMLARTDGKSGRPLELLRTHKRLLTACLVCVWLTGSAFAMLAAPVAIVLSLSRRWIIAALVMLWLLWPVFSSVDSISGQRALTFLAALPSLDIDKIADADQSASLRILPLLIYHQKLSAEQLTFWFGAGIDGIRAYIQGELIGAGDAVMAGFYPGYVISFGLVGTVLFLFAFVFRFVSRSTLPIVVLWLLLFATSAWNVQLFWYGLMLIRVGHHFRRTDTSGAVSHERGLAIEEPQARTALQRV